MDLKLICKYCLSLAFLVGGLFSCMGPGHSDQSLVDRIEARLFARFGTMMFSDVAYESLQTIQVDGSRLVAQPIIVKGAVENVGGESTYLVLREDNAKMLVDLSSLAELPLMPAPKVGGEVAVYGRLFAREQGRFIFKADALYNGKVL